MLACMCCTYTELSKYHGMHSAITIIQALVKMGAQFLEKWTCLPIIWLAFSALNTDLNQ